MHKDAKITMINVNRGVLKYVIFTSRISKDFEDDSENYDRLK